MSIDLILEKQDLTYLSWTKIRNSSGTAGSFLKAQSDLSGKKKYYKLSNYDAINGIIGHESVNELIVSRLLNVLDVEHLAYRLIHSDVLVEGKIFDTFICESDDFKSRGESKISLDQFYYQEKLEEESMLDFCLRNNWGDYIWEMLVVDFLILNRDRHGANIEVLRNTITKSYRLAPLFDHGVSLLFSCKNDIDVESFDVLDDKRIQCCVGSQSAYDNLNLIPKESIPHLKRLSESDKEYILGDLNSVLSPLYLNKIWEMIWKRWCYFESFCDRK